MISNTVVTPIQVYYEDTTTNLSFTKMHYFLKAKGIKNNKFFLIIYDAGLMGVDPRDPNLSFQMKLRVTRECTINYWYFLRNVCKIPEEGGAVGSGVSFQLNRANLAMNYMFVYNINQFLEEPRQMGKTMGALCWYLWIFNFGSTNSKIMFANKKHEDSKRNLKTLKDLRSALPEYLRMEAIIGPDGKQVKAPNTAETLQNPVNKNVILTLPGARTPSLADGAGRGCTIPLLWYDEFAFLPYNDIVYTAAAPAFSRASENAKRNNSPFGMIITTTPGDLTTREGQFAYRVRNNATEWNESFYDLTYEQLMERINSNPDSNFVHIKYTYQMLGKGPDYFERMVKDLQKDWVKIRREVMLEWAKTSDNNPFDREDLEIIESLTRPEPRYTLYFGKAGQFPMKFWDEIPIGSPYPPIIGVDVASGRFKDSSAVTVIDSQTTKVIATFKSNFITMPELADLIYQFVTGYAKNAIVVVESNGGFGTSVLQMLLKTSIKQNLYYEIKDRIDEEQFDGMTVKKRKRRCKVYGATSTKGTRDKLIELLHQRVKHHRDKFNTREIYDELCSMVVRPNGKVEHSDDSHDDLVFSYLWALYVFYYGEDLVNRFHLLKTEIYTDDHYDETSYNLEEEYDENEQIDQDVFNDDDNEINKMVSEQLAILNSHKSYTLEDFYKDQIQRENKILQKIAQTEPGREAISKTLHIDKGYLEKQNTMGYIDIGDDLNKIWYSDDTPKSDKEKVLFGNLAKQFENINNLR